ncbi:osteoclast-associated immunoglobulin-like receptor isoform X2 [Gopherus evgoodei]|uniref:osteoclast-associated immunoglobulin-like receptor isoform X2 n=1 Tax=Gopherus evgoodei TaxID=1825980 RepID=UPI0011CFB06C|nr:osteoclast-associated immunoglobulin-like receptor isoform X2 [Gopherus evgoodei]
MASALTVLLLEGFYSKPSISVSPSGVIPVGGNVTIRCWHLHQNMRIQLYKAGDGNYLSYTDPAGSEAEFPITSARREHGGSYTCRYIYRSGGTVYSEPSDPVQIIVTDPSLPRPSISLSPSGVTAPGADVTIQCQGPRWDVRFFLHKAGDLNPQQHMDPAGAGAEFRIPTVGRQHGGSYSCSYRPRSEPFVFSQPSDTVQLVVADAGSVPAGRTDSAQPGAVPAPTHPGSAWPGRSEPPAPPGLTSLTIAGVSAAAVGLLLLLLLLVAFVCFRKTRARKGATPRPSSTIPLAVLKAPAQQDPIYSSIDEGKETQTLPQEPDSYGLTYAELNHQALQAKQGGLAPAPDPVQPSVYAAINVSQGGSLQ